MCRESKFLADDSRALTFCHRKALFAGVLCRATIQYRVRRRQMANCPIKFGTSGWRGIIAEEFTFGNVRLAVSAIAQHVLAKNPKPTLLLARDQRFFAEEFLRTAAIVLTEHGVHPLVCSGATPTPTVAFEVRRRKVDGAINFTASHNPADYHGLKFSGADGGPALPEVTKDIEARAANIVCESETGRVGVPWLLRRAEFRDD